MSCGISPGFPRLSPTRGQVSYVLLTRAPLYSLDPACAGSNFLVRLACVRHAASVDSEPGSNSRLILGRHADGLVRQSAHPVFGALPNEPGRFRLRPSPTGRSSSLSVAQRPCGLCALTWHAQLSCQRTGRPGLEPGAPIGQDRQPLPPATLLEGYPAEQFLSVSHSAGLVKRFSQTKKTRSGCYPTRPRPRSKTGEAPLFIAYNKMKL